ncbi:MAG: sigma 54-interacting transcriptional regulator [Desulfobacteraceae bacterium]|jgi:two-component system response regulator AtoC
MTPTVLLITEDTHAPKHWAALLEEAECLVAGPLPGKEAALFLKSNLPDVVFFPPSLHPKILLESLQLLKVVAPAVPILMVSEEPELFATDLCGPFEGVSCLSPDAGTKEIIQALDRALSSEAQCNGGPTYPVIIGQTPALQEIRERVRTVAEKNIAVLITGESGTGKELIARAIHCHSNRRLEPLVKISCGALPDDLLESEVFGYQRGAFTGAYANKPGRLELAHGGTLFLDEVGDLSLPLQVKFLQVLEEKIVSRLGGTEEKLVDTRVVAATNANLIDRVREGTFRKDLFYRLSVISIQAPPLRERLEDVPLLAHYFMHKYSAEIGRPVQGLPASEVRRLSSYTWPGNVRELENLTRRAVVTQGWNFLDQALDGARMITEKDDPNVRPNEQTNRLHVWPEQKIADFITHEGGSLKTLVQAYTAEVEQSAIRQVLEDVRWNRKQAAERLGVSYKTLLNRIASLDLNKA